MGVRFYDKENMSNEDNFATTTHTNCNCNTCHLLTTTTTSTACSTSATETTTSSLNNTHKSGIQREIIGNCKEVRIEDNIHNLRIVGNNNRIRINLNVGDITIVGNNTRLKIKINHGLIKYTGNNGRISLGKESSEQLVDYSGCNGVLKVQNSKKSKQTGTNIAAHDADDEMGSTSFNENLSKCKKQKYASFSGLSAFSETFKCCNNFDRKTSMPNITTKSYHSDNRVHPKPKNIVPNFGNIVIANSSNICINPYTYTF